VRIAVCGTGTGVGKTHVLVAMALALRTAGICCASLKPVESGGDSDAQSLMTASQFHVKPAMPYQLARPVSPHLAARESNTVISIDAIVAWVDRVSLGSQVTCVETAGGLLSPLTDRSTNLNLIRALNPHETLVVAPDRIGVLHDLAALTLAAKSLGLAPTRFVLTAPAQPDASTGTNAKELERIGTCVITTVFPRSQPGSSTSQRAARDLLVAMQILEPTTG